MASKKKWLLEYKNNDYDGPFRGMNFEGKVTEWFSERHLLDLRMNHMGYALHPVAYRNHDKYGNKHPTDTGTWERN